MIIVTTKQGTTLINDSEIQCLSHIKEEAKVVAVTKENRSLEIGDVTDIQYVANSPIDWRDKGNLFLQNEKIIDGLRSDINDCKNRLSFERWAHMIFDDCISNIVSVCKNQDMSDKFAREKTIEYCENIVDRVTRGFNERKARNQL